MLLQFLTDFFIDARVLTLAGLILADAILGVWAALATGAFDQDRVLEFYRTKLLPMLGGYLSLFLIARFAPDSIDAIGDGVLWTAFLVTFFLVGDSARENFATIYGVVLKRKEPLQ